MNMETIYYKTVKCSDGLPEKADYYCAKHNKASHFESYYYKDGEWFYTKIHAENEVTRSLEPVTLNITHWLEEEKTIDVEEAFEKLYKIMSPDFANSSSWKDDLRRAFLAGSQIRVKETKSVDVYNDGGDRCGGCHQYFASKVKYCPNCGSKIQWK